MIRLCRVPRPPLSEFVALLWLFERVAPHARERVLPTGSIELVINLKDEIDRSFDGVIVGPQSRFFMLDTSRPTLVVGAHFRPGGALPFFALPMHELSDRHLPLEACWGRQAAELRERLLEAETGEAKLLLLECALLRLMKRTVSRHAAIGHAVVAFRQGLRRVGDVVAETGISQRRFIRLFSEEVGLSPKAFCRIRRFQQAVSVLHRAEVPKLADIALACGYFDQPHMIHDFQDFAGMTPTQYLSRRSALKNHVPQ